MTYIKVANKENLYRDSYSNGIVNGDFNEYKNYVSEYKNKIENQKRLENLENDVKSLKDCVFEIKTMLNQIIK
jgi:hypothetical protein